MPRIEAATVAEHHALRRAALLSAGRTLLAEHGIDAVTPKAVGEQAGIARSSVYQYFPSTSALVAAIVEDAFVTANATIEEALAHQDSPRDRIDTYLRISLDLATGPSHRMFDSVDPSTLPAETQQRIDALHHAQTAPLIEAVRECGAPQPELAVHLIAGMMSAAARAISMGADRDATEHELLRAVQHGPVPQ